MAGETQRKIFGPKLVLETGNQLVGMSGKTSFCMQSTTDAGVRFVQAHTESGNTKIMTEGCLMIEAGEKGKCVDDIVFISNTGGMSFSADAGTYRVSAEQIVLQADKEIVIDAPSIRIGSQDANGTKDIIIAAKNVDADAKGGNIGDILGTSNFMEIFSGGILGGLAAAIAGIAGAAGGSAGNAGLGQDGTGASGVGGGGGGLTLENLTVDNITINEILQLLNGEPNQFLMADGSISTRYVSSDSTAPSDSLGQDGDTYLIVEC